MRKFMKVFANVIAADFGRPMKLQIWRNSSIKICSLCSRMWPNTFTIARIPRKIKILATKLGL